MFHFSFPGTALQKFATGRPSDLQWGSYIDLAASGDQQALARLYDESSRLIYSIVVRIVGDAADAEEVTLDVYQQVWRLAGQYNSERGTPSTWLVMMARSRALDRLRWRQGRVRMESGLDEVRDQVSSDNPPELAAWENQKRTRIQSAMGELAPEQREAIQLAFFEGLTHSELAAKLGQPLGTIKTRIRLGMLKLRQSLGAIEGLT
jgi:RNA polymerase sigma-70 factor (ECF subfamily)